jgi:hypothetical protein
VEVQNVEDESLVVSRLWDDLEQVLVEYALAVAPDSDLKCGAPRENWLIADSCG